MLVLANKTVANRILNILQDGVENLAAVLSLTSSTSKPPAPPLSTLLNKQEHLEKNLCQISSCSSSAGSSKILRILHPATRNLARAWRQHTQASNIASSISASSPPMTAAAASFLDTMQELQHLLAQRLQTTVQDDLRVAIILGNLTDKERMALGQVTSLQETYRSKCQAFSKEASALQALIEKLRNEVADLTAKVDREETAIMQETEITMNLATKSHEIAKESLHQRIATLVSEIQVSTEEYKEEEETAKKEQHRLEEELAAFVEQYEATAREKREALASLRHTLQNEQAELHELEEHFHLVETQEEELRQIEEARQHRLRQEQEKMHNFIQCAIRIQAIFRGYKALTSYKLSKLTKAKGPAKKKGAGGKGKAGGGGAKKGGDAAAGAPAAGGKGKKEEKGEKGDRAAAASKKPATATDKKAAAAAPTKKPISGVAAGGATKKKK